MNSISATLTALEISDDAEDPLRNFLTLFHKWNRSINLSAARSEHEIADHVVDSLHVVPHLRTATAIDDGDAPRILDVGSGGGLPGVVIAICLPNVQLTALEPIHKKHAFLRTAARELRLSNLEPLAQRIDQHPSRDYAAATSRATFDLREWLLLGLGYVRDGGAVLGFEAITRSDLPPDTRRFPYSLEDKSRAIVTLHRPPPP
jgi:16S rRNA (guanine527-N7)-methyltransferase